jgi:hypothetical protein
VISRLGPEPISQTYPSDAELGRQPDDAPAAHDRPRSHSSIKPRLAAAQSLAEPDPASQRYVLSCAAIAASSRLLVAAHAAVGAPTATVVDSDRALREAIAQARTGAGAMSVVAGRLLTRVREDEAMTLPDLPAPVRADIGVTTPGLRAETGWRTTRRAMVSAAIECAAAADALECCSAPDDVQRAMAGLVRIAELMKSEFVDQS